MDKDNTKRGTSPLEVTNPSYEKSEELEVLHETHRLINLDSPNNHRKPELKRSVSLGDKTETGLVTRSKVTDSFEHKELVFEKKTRSKKMVTIRLEDAFKLIPLCTGEDDIYSFVNACDMAVGLVEEKNAPTLVKYITTRLTGRALEMIKYKNVTKWAYIKTYLTDAFEDLTTASSLQIQLNSIRMRQGEDVNDYCHRVEKLYYKLCTVSTLNKVDSEARVIHETLKEQTLAIFIKGLISPIRTIVKAQCPKTLEIAKQLAKAEEAEFNSERENSRYRNDYSNNRNNNNLTRNNTGNFHRTNIRPNNNNRNFRPNNFTNNFMRTNNYSQPNNINRPVVKCYHCNGNHYASQCRNNYASNSNNNHTPNRNNFTRPSTGYNISQKTCAYCNRVGHNINECYKKRNDESRNNNNSGNVNVSNGERGTRSINQIVAEETHDASTSSHQ